MWAAWCAGIGPTGPNWGTAIGNKFTNGTGRAIGKDGAFGGGADGVRIGEAEGVVTVAGVRSDVDAGTGVDPGMGVGAGSGVGSGFGVGVAADVGVVSGIDTGAGVEVEGTGAVAGGFAGSPTIGGDAVKIGSKTTARRLMTSGRPSGPTTVSLTA